MTWCLRGEIYYADLSPVRGHEQAGIRPVLVIQNDVGNRYSSVTIVAAITSATGNGKHPVEVDLPAGAGGLSRASVVLTNQIRTVDKSRLERCVGQLEEVDMARVDEALRISLGLVPI